MTQEKRKISISEAEYRRLKRTDERHADALPLVENLKREILGLKANAEALHNLLRHKK
jgi:hypothetical protein